MIISSKKKIDVEIVYFFHEEIEPIELVEKFSDKLSDSCDGEVYEILSIAIEKEKFDGKLKNDKVGFLDKEN